nr:retrotransposon protein, putative, Ty1-copia subclass [Tanacetum cinerariifolium]
MVNGYCRAGKVGNAVEVFFQMCRMGVCLSEYALMRMLSCLVKVKRVDVITDVCLELGNDYTSLCAEPYGLQSVKDYLRKCFAIKDLGKAAFILGIKIYRDRSKRLIGLGQNAYMVKILKRYKMDNSKRGHIFMQERLDLNKTQSASTPKEVKRMQNVPYASAVRSIMYAVRCTRPDVAFAQNITSRY